MKFKIFYHDKLKLCTLQELWIKREKNLTERKINSKIKKYLKPSRVTQVTKINLEKKEFTERWNLQRIMKKRKIDRQRIMKNRNTDRQMNEKERKNKIVKKEEWKEQKEGEDRQTERTQKTKHTKETDWKEEKKRDDIRRVKKTDRELSQQT